MLCAAGRSARIENLLPAWLQLATCCFLEGLTCARGPFKHCVRAHEQLPTPAVTPGSCLVLKGNGADIAKHCVPAVTKPRISITLRKCGPTLVYQPGAQSPHTDNAWCANAQQARGCQAMGGARKVGSCPAQQDFYVPSAAATSADATRLQDGEHARNQGHSGSAPGRKVLIMAIAHRTNVSVFFKVLLHVLDQYSHTDILCVVN